MSFEIITDSASNLTDDLLEQNNIQMISYSCLIDENEYLCHETGRDHVQTGKHFYDLLRKGSNITTSLINKTRITEFFEPILQKGKDILFTSISSGISGTFQEAKHAVQELLKKYPERQCYAVDSLAASFGEGLMVLKLAELRKKGFSIQEARDWLEQSKLKMRQVFTVGELHFLRRGGRLSGAAAFVGSLLNIKPLLKGNEEGQIVLNGKTRGMKKALDSLAKDLQEHIVSPETQTIAIAHCDCESDATYLADKIRSLVNVKDIIIRYYDLCTGAHVGPGTVALFYMGDHR